MVKPVRGALLLVCLVLSGWALSDDQLIGGGPGFGAFQGVVLAVGLGAGLCALGSHALATTALTGVLSIMVAAGLGELMLRSMFGERFGSIYVLSEPVLYGLKPNSAREFVHTLDNGGGVVRSRVNAFGFRGDEINPQKDGMRVVVYGDSFVHAEYTALENTFAKRLETHMATSSGTEVEVINAGVSGYGPDQILLRLEKELPWIKPDLLIVAIYLGNDFGDLVRNKLFRLDEQGTMSRNAPTIEPTLVQWAERGDGELMIRKVIRNASQMLTAAEGSPDPEIRMRAAMAQQIREYEEYVHAGDNVVRELRSDPYSIDVSAAPDSASAQYKVALMSAVMGEIKTIAQHHGVPLRVVLVPSPIDVGFGHHGSGVVASEEFPHYDPDRLTRTMSQICLDSNLECIDLLPVFRAHGGVELYLQGGDDHWNDQGQNVAARHVALMLEADNILGVDG